MINFIRKLILKQSLKIRIVANNVAYANGIDVSLDGSHLFVASPTAMGIFVYEKFPNGTLKEKDRLHVVSNTGKLFRKTYLICMCALYL
jgi:sugar lactone lactonase YvrE